MLPAGEIVCPFYMRFRVPNNTHQICANALRGISSRLPYYSLEWSVLFCHTSHVTRHTSHVTRHTSHVTRHTSHVTRHTSHVTRTRQRCVRKLLRRRRNHARVQRSLTLTPLLRIKHLNLRYWLHTRGCEAQGSTPTWDFSRFVPDCLIINLGTNDFVRELFLYY
jgi:hypothetical protein